MTKNKKFAKYNWTDYTTSKGYVIHHRTDSNYVYEEYGAVPYTNVPLDVGIGNLYYNKIQPYEINFGVTFQSVWYIDTFVICNSGIITSCVHSYTTTSFKYWLQSVTSNKFNITVMYHVMGIIKH